MRFCPTCQTRYDEEILRFCTKDGTPLLEEDKPNFTELPSESAEDDDSDEVTVIRRNSSRPIVPAPEVPNVEQNSMPRIVIPTTQNIKEQSLRTRATASYRQPPPREANTGKIVLLTVLGTLIVLMGGGIAYLFLTRESSDDSNENRIINANFNSIGVNVNANLNSNSLSNFDFNANTNSNLNVNTNTTNVNTRTNVNTKTPTPTPKPSATPNDNTNTNSNLSNSNTGTPTPSATRPSLPRPSLPPTPSASPIAPPPPPPPSNRPVNAGVLNGRAATLPKPAYPPIAKQMRAAGQVAVQVFVDETGNVTAAKATSGNSLLRAPAEAAARQSRINPIIVGDRAVKATGILVYNFTNQ